MEKKILLSVLFFTVIFLLALTINVQAASDIDSLKEEINSEKTEVTLDSNVTISNQTVTLDLNGKTLFMKGTITIANGGKLTVTGNGTVIAADKAINTLFGISKGGS